MSSPVSANGESRGSALMRTYLDRWSLSLDGPVISGNNSAVQPVRTEHGVPAMLRLAPVTRHTAHDWLALSIWDGDGAVRLFRYDETDGAYLLERLDHTRNLNTLPVDEAIEVMGTLRARLSRPAPPGIRTLEHEAELWVQKLSRESRLPKRITDEAIGLCRELGPGATTHLVNEDQHECNILAGDREPWLVIDPLVVAADREYGLTNLLWGRLAQSTTDRMLTTLIDTGSLDPDRARAWTFVGAVVKWTNSQGWVADNCRTIAYTLTSLNSTT